MKNIELNFDLKNFNLQRFVFVRRYLMMGLGMLLVGLLLVVFAIAPQIQRSTELNFLTKKDAELLRQLQQKVRELNEVEDLQAYANSQKVELALPSEKPLLQLLSSMSYVAQDSKVTLSDIQTNPGRIASASTTVVAPPPGTPALDLQQTGLGALPTLNLELNVRGQIDNIYDFLDKIERVTPITQVTGLKLSRVAPNQDLYVCKLTLSTYYFTQPIYVTIDAPLPEVGSAEQNFLNQLDTFIFPDFQRQQQIQGGGSSDLFGVGSTPRQ